MTTVAITSEPAKRYVAPRLPKVGDRVYERSVFRRSGKVRVVLDERRATVIVVRYRRKGYDSWVCYTSADWDAGWLRPG